MSNYDALHDLIDYARTRKALHRLGRTYFSANVAFTTSTGTIRGEARVRASGHSGDRERLVIYEAWGFSERDVPFGHVPDYNTWAFHKRSLTIEGIHPRHGDYTLVITFTKR